MADDVNENLEFTVMPPVGPESRAPLEEGGARKSYKKIIIAVVVVLLLAAAGFFSYLYFFIKKEAAPEAPKPSSASDIKVPEPEVDTDKDGLKDKLENQKGTKPTDRDSDDDGLADGDEVNVYGSDPLLPDTDSDGFPDGREVARGFSPRVNTPAKASPMDLVAWEEKIAKFGLHDPTPTTLKLMAETVGAAEKTKYTNSAFSYSVEFSSLLTFREQQNGQVVGIYVAGTTPEDPDAATDPISLTIAVKVSTQSLEDWVKSQYVPGDYLSLEKKDIGSIPVIRLKEIRNDVCNQEKVFYPKNNTIIVLTLICTQSKEIADLYSEIVESFKFE